MTVLFRYEAKSIQNYILNSSILREITGASELIDSLASEVRDCVGERGFVIAAAAGGGTIQFSSIEMLSSFLSEWGERSAREFPQLQIIHAWVDDEEASDPRERKQRLQQRLHAARNRAVSCLPPIGPLVARAGRTGEPAVANTGVLASRGTQARLARAETGHLFDRFVGRDVDVRLRPELDLSEFPEGYLGVIHADGNGLGSLFVGLDEPADVKLLSRICQSSSEEASRAASRWFVGPYLSRERIDTADGVDIRVPLRPVVLGGDDMTVILPAEDCIGFANQYLRTFASSTARGMNHEWTNFTDAARASLGPYRQRGFSACAGIALVKQAFPFHAAFSLAHQLCDAAKFSIREHAAPERPLPSALLFHRVTDSSLSHWTDIAKEDLLADNARSLVGGPYLVGEATMLGGLGTIESLEQTARAVDAMPRGAIRQWITLAKESDLKADAHWRRMRDVAKLASSHAFDELCDALAAFGPTDPDATEPWRDGKTVLLDALTWVRVGTQGHLL